MAKRWPDAYVLCRQTCPLRKKTVQCTMLMTLVFVNPIIALSSTADAIFKNMLLFVDSRQMEAMEMENRPEMTFVSALLWSLVPPRTSTTSSDVYSRHQG